MEERKSRQTRHFRSVPWVKPCVVAAQAALGLSVVNMEALPPGEITPPPKNCFATGSPRKSLPPSPGYGGQVAPCDGRLTPLSNSGLVFSGPGFLSVPFVSFCSRSIEDRRDACATLEAGKTNIELRRRRGACCPNGTERGCLTRSSPECQMSARNSTGFRAILAIS